MKKDSYNICWYQFKVTTLHRSLLILIKVPLIKIAKLGELLAIVYSIAIAKIFQLMELEKLKINNKKKLKIN